MAITSLSRYATEAAASFPSRMDELLVIPFSPITQSIVLFIDWGAEEQWLASPSEVTEITAALAVPTYKRWCRRTAILRGGTSWRPFERTHASRSATFW